MLLDNRWGEQLVTAFRNCTNIGDQTENYWKWLFRNRDTSLPIILTADTDEYRDYSRAFGLPTQVPNSRRATRDGIRATSSMFGGAMACRRSKAAPPNVHDPH